MDAREYLRLAETLARGAGEAEWRSAVSRAYYAVFHLAGQLLTDCGFAVARGERAHAYSWRRLANCGNADLQRAANDLNDLRGARNRADYDFHRTVRQHAASADVHSAQEIARALSAAGTTSIKAAITEAIRVYERDILKEPTWQG